MKRIAWIAVVMLLAAGSVPAAAQKDQMRMGEELRATIKRAQPQTTTDKEVDVVVAPKEGRVVVQGDLKAIKLAPQIRDSLTFLVSWGKGKAGEVPIQTPDFVATTKTTSVVLPIGSLSTVRMDGRIVGVRVGQFKIKSGEKIVERPAVLMLREVPGDKPRYEVRAVVIGR